MRFQIAMHNQIRKHGVDNDLDISTFVLEKKRKVQEMLRFGQTAKELGALQNCRGYRGDCVPNLGTYLTYLFY